MEFSASGKQKNDSAHALLLIFSADLL